MRQNIAIFLFAAASLVCFGGYCAALIDWVQDYSTGVYQRNLLEAFLETGALCLYTFLGIRFLRHRVPFL